MSQDILPSDYEVFLQSIKMRVQQAQFQALVAVNKELILLYWHIGNGIWERQKQYGWGGKVIQQLSNDLRREFPSMKGFSSRNLQYMRTFAEAYPDETQFAQQPVAQIPWGHHCIILDKVRDIEQRLWYIQQTVKNGWSRNILAHQIDAHLHLRQGKALTNFPQTLPSPQSDLAQDVLKDPYIFDFLMLQRASQEKVLQAALLQHLQNFLLELGMGFTFVGSNYYRWS
jgi:predicted nuclease of restriction endonuclease-like (RecB) superfamily